MTEQEEFNKATDRMLELYNKMILHCEGEDFAAVIGACTAITKKCIELMDDSSAEYTKAFVLESIASTAPTPTKESLIITH